MSTATSNQTISFTRGIEFLARVGVLSGSGDISAWTLRFRIFVQVGATPLVTLTIGSGITVLDAAAGLIELFLSPDETAAVRAGTFLWDLERTDGGTLNYQIAGGTVTVTDPSGTPTVTPALCPPPLYTATYGEVFDQQLRPSRPAAIIRSGTPAAVRLDLFSVNRRPGVVQLTGYCGSANTAAIFAEAVCGQPIAAAATLSDDGTYVTAELPAEVYNAPGVYEVEARVQDAAGADRAFSRALVYVEPSGFGGWRNGPPPLDDIRWAIRDYPAANKLLGDYQFSDAEVSLAIVQAVRRFNMAPPLSTLEVRTTTWPRQAWANLVDGVLADLFVVAASYYRAGHLPYSAGGVSVDDMAKEKDYLSAQAACQAKWEYWIRMTKSAINIMDGFGSLESPYNQGYSYW